jgi:hypothetical protein
MSWSFPFLALIAKSEADASLSLKTRLSGVLDLFFSTGPDWQQSLVL